MRFLDIFSAQDDGLVIGYLMGTDFFILAQFVPVVTLQSVPITDIAAIGNNL